MTEVEFVERVTAMRLKLYHVGRALLWDDEDAADAVQEAMLKAWKQRRALREEERFEAWFMRVFLNQCRDMQRRQIRLRQASAAFLERRAGDTGTPALDALNDLNDDLRLPTLLHHVQGFTLRETAEMLNLTVDQVRARLKQARRYLKSDLTGDDEYAP